MANKTEYYFFQPMMQQIPYELLQHIASSLLPRYQCRLALTSRHHHRYLYTPLLKWHALKQHIKPPTHKIFNFLNEKLYSLIISDNRVQLMNITSSYLYINNLTTLTSCNVSPSGKIIRTYMTSSRTFYYNPVLYDKILRTAQACKYAHKDYLLTMLNSKQSIVLLCSSRRIRNYIVHALDNKALTAIYQCKHLSFIFAP